MNNKYYLATVLLALGAFSPLYGVQNTPPPPHNCIYNHRTTKTNQKYPSVNL